MFCYYSGRTTIDNNDKHLWTNYFWSSFLCFLVNGVNILLATTVDALQIATLTNIYKLIIFGAASRGQKCMDKFFLHSFPCFLAD